VPNAIAGNIGGNPSKTFNLSFGEDDIAQSRQQLGDVCS
jgi:hypothetical protein